MAKSKFDFGAHLKEIQSKLKSGELKTEPLDPKAEDDEMGEPDEKK